MALIIAVALPKGGVGKTTLANAIANGLVVEDPELRVGIIDYDEQGGASRWKNLTEEGGGTLPYDVIAVRPDQLAKWVRLNGDDYDVLVIDGRPDDSDHNRLAVRQAHFVWIPCQPYGDAIDRVPEWHAYCLKYDRPHMVVLTQVSPFSRGEKSDSEIAREILGAIDGLTIAEIEMKWNPSNMARSYGGRPGRALTRFGRSLTDEMTTALADGGNS